MTSILYLIAHTNPDGTGVAQKPLFADSMEEARETFTRLYPHRVITVVGVWSP